MSFIVLCSLGNPGPQYSKTRHNLGHLINDKLREEYDFPGWSAGRNCQVSRSHRYPVMLYKSHSYMNDSGRNIAGNWPSLRRKLQDEGYDPVLVIVHDDFHVSLGKVRVCESSRAHRGHNGVKNCVERLGNFVDVAVGCGRIPSGVSAEEFVLSRFGREELAEMEDIADTVWEKLQEIVD